MKNRRDRVRGMGLMGGIAVLALAAFSACVQKPQAPRSALPSSTVPLAKTTEGEDCDAAFGAFMSLAEKDAGFGAIHDFHRDHTRCMDGAFAAGVSGAIADALDRNWGKIAELEERFTRDPAFKKFFFQNISALVSASEQELESVLKKSQASCPQGQERLCREIGAEASGALKAAREEMPGGAS